MTQTTAIILRFREEEADHFESLFQAHVLSMRCSSQSGF
jgi:hypothetical protein